MERNDFDRRFEDFAECNDYYLDEIGKLEQARGMLRKRYFKEKHNLICQMWNMDAQVFKNDVVMAKKVEKTELNEFKQEYSNEHELGLWNKTKRVTNTVLSPIKALTTKLFKRKKKDPKVEVVEIDCSEQPKRLEASKDVEKEQPQSIRENPGEEAKNE